MLTQDQLTQYQGQLDVPVVGVPSTTQIEVQVGVSTIVYLQPTGATYDAQTGILNVTFPNHGLEEGQHIKVTRNSFTFTCGLDDHNRLIPILERVILLMVLMLQLLVQVRTHLRLMLVLIQCS